MRQNAGIVGTGCYLPDYRVSAQILSEVWGNSGGSDGQKSVPNDDEDATTMAIAAGRSALEDAGVAVEEIDAVWVGTESKPYAAKAVSATVAAALGLTPWVGAADLEFACRGAVEGLSAMAARVQSGQCRYGLVIGVDAAQGRPGDELERTAGAGAAAFVVGPANRAWAVLGDSVTYVTDAPDFFRRDGVPYPLHAHRFTGQPAYFHHVAAVVRAFLEQSATGTSDYRYAVFHQPNEKFPRQLALSLGFTPGQIDPVSLVQLIGNTYAANCFLGIIRALDLATVGDQILVSAYGSGAGADCFALRVSSRISDTRRSQLQSYLERGTDVREYGEYLMMTRQVGCRR